MPRSGVGAAIAGPNRLGDFCVPVHAYSYKRASDLSPRSKSPPSGWSELYELDLDDADAQAQLDSAIDGVVPRTELRTDRQTAYGKGFLAGMDAANEIGAEHGTPSPPGVSELNIRFVGAADLTDQSKSSLPAEVIERIQDGVVQVTAGSGSGSGFIIDESGVVVTNEHVVRGQGASNVGAR